MSPMSKIKDLWKYTVAEQRIWAIMVLVGLLGSFNGAMIDWVNDEVPLWVTLPVGILSTLAVIAYPLYQTFLYPVQLETRMIAQDHDAGQKMLIQIREKAKSMGLKIEHECMPDAVDIEIPGGMNFLGPSVNLPKIYPVHLVIEGRHWRMRKFAAVIDETIHAVSGVHAQVQGISHMNQPFPGGDNTES